jgi:hypothetical protein
MSERTSRVVIEDARLSATEYAHTGIDEWHTAQEWVAATARSPITAVPDA